MNEETTPNDAPEAEVKGALITPEEIAEFEAGQDFQLPRNKDVEPDGDDDDKDDDEPASVVDEALDQDDPADDEAVDDSDDEEEDDTPEPVVAPQGSVEDPGEYVPADYSFEVVKYDDEGNNPKVIKISSVEQWDEFLNEDPNLGSASLLLKAQRLATRMEQQSIDDKKSYDAKKEAYEADQARVAHETETLNTWQSEIDYLVRRGDLPQVPAAYKDADWADPQVAKQAGVKEQVELLNFMKKENAARIKSGLKPMTSMLDAFNSYQLDQSRQQGTAKKRADAEKRKAAGARVAGSTPNPVSVAPKGIAVGRGGSLDDLG